METKSASFYKHRDFSYAIARILDEAVESSYRIGGRHASITGANITKETMMNKIHSWQFSPVDKPNERSSEILVTGSVKGIVQGSVFEYLQNAGYI